MKYLAIILIALLLSACTPQQRLANLVKHHPELAVSKIKVDTLVLAQIDTFVLEAWQIDTFFSFDIDTVFQIQKDSLKINIKKQPRGKYLLDILFPKTLITKADTVRIAYTDTIQTLQYMPIDTATAWQYRKEGFLILGGILLLIFLIATIGKMYI